MLKRLKVSLSPHVGTKETVFHVMRDVVIALMPIIIMALIYYKERVVVTVGISLVSALVSEGISCRLMNKKISIFNGSAVITALLFSMVVPPYLLWWQIAIGASVAIILGKMIFGGLGQNIFNPAFVGLAFLMNSWPVELTSWGTQSLDGMAGATPLQVMKLNGYSKVLEVFGGKTNLYSLMFFGNHSGSLGEVSVLAILIGGLYLLVRKQITWHIPLTYIATVFFLSLIMGNDPIFQIMAGGLMLGSFFMATDMVTSPLTGTGKIIFGIGAGILTVIVRTEGGYYEGVCYSVLFMNSVTPLINKFAKTKVFGG